MTMQQNPQEHRNTVGTERKTWRKPTVVVHGDLLTLTRLKDPGGTDSGLGTPAS